MGNDQNQAAEVMEQQFENIVSVDDGKMFTTSLLVAEAFEKEHKNVLRDIENLECSPEFRRLNFEQTPYVHPQNGETYPAYRLTRDGFAFLAMGFTGKKAAAWKEKFLEAFNAMEAALLEEREAQRAVPREEKKEIHDTGRASPFFESRKKLTKGALEALKGLLHMESFVQEKSWEEAKGQFCQRMNISSIEELSQNKFDVAVAGIFESLFFVRKWEKQENEDAPENMQQAFHGMISFWKHMTGYPESEIRNYVINRCGVGSMGDISTKRDISKAIFVLWGGIANHTLKAQSW